MKLDDLRPDDGCNLLDEIFTVITRYVILPSEAAAIAVTLWVAATHAQAAWEHATRLVVKSPEKRCGKSRLLEVLGELVHRAIRTTNISPAALVRSIDEHDPPTIILDEADTVFAKRRGERSESAEDVRGILNSGHARGWPYIRWNASARMSESCPTFAMAAIGGIGDMPDTIEDRAVVIPMQRRAAGEVVHPFRRRRAVAQLNELRDRVHDWLSGLHETLAGSEPEMPVEDRAADVWESLIAIADLAGGSWPARARAACVALTSNISAEDDSSLGERLLRDIHATFGTLERMPTADILVSLNGMEEAPWADLRGRPMVARDLSRLLRPYGIASTTLRIGSSTPKGYLRSAFEPAWSRYVRAAATLTTSATNDGLSVGVESARDVAALSPAIRNTSATSERGGFEHKVIPSHDLVAGVARVSEDRIVDVPCEATGCNLPRVVDGSSPYCWRHQ